MNIIYLPCLIGLVGIFYKRDFPFKELVLLLLFYLLVEKNSSNLSAATNHKTIVLYPYYLVVEIALLYLHFKKVIPRVLTFAVFIVVVLIILEAAYFNSETLLLSKFVEPITISIMCICWFSSTFKMKERKVERMPGFWITSSMLFYFMPVVFLLPIEYGFLQVESIDQVFSLHTRWVINILSKLALSIGLWMQLKS